MNRGLLKTRIGSLVLSIAFCALLLTGCGCTINRRNVGMNNTGPPCITGSIVDNARKAVLFIRVKPRNQRRNRR